jgi:hypothetical protein
MTQNLGWLRTRFCGEGITGVREGKRHDRGNYIMRIVVSFYTICYNGSDIKNGEMVVTYRAYGGDEKCVQNFSGATYREE